MWHDFDFFDMVEKPPIILCNPNRDQLCSLDLAYRTNYKPRFNAVSEFTFTYPESVEGVVLEAYPLLVSKRHIFIDPIGWFIVVDVEEALDGMKNVKLVTAYSLEAEALNKKITAFSGTYQFSGTAPDGIGVLMDEVLSMIPAWSLAYVDPTVASKSRTFDISDNTVYNFLMTDVEAAYECVFIFDTINRQISVYSRSNATTDTDIYLSHDNLVKRIVKKEKSDEIATCLHVYGNGDLDIRTVNPLGTNKIYDFSYFKNTAWMSQSLIDALNAWEDKVDDFQPVYADTLTIYKNTNASIVVKQTELTDLLSELSTLQAVQKSRIAGGLDHSEIDAKIVAKQAEITDKRAQIASLQKVANSQGAKLTEINNSLSFASNFSTVQLVELSNYIFENTYKNENFVQTDIMTNVEIQEMSQELYDQAQVVIARVAQPRYEFSVEAANFLFMPEFQEFIDQLALGCVVKIEVKEDEIVDAILLEISYSFDDPEDFSITFGNRVRLDNEDFKFSDLIGPALKANSGEVNDIAVNEGFTGYIYASPTRREKIMHFENGLLVDVTVN
jgi:hypothetical protein